MPGKNPVFTEQLKKALREKGIPYEPGKKGELKKFAEDNGLGYTTLHKYLRVPGHMPTGDILLRLSEIFNKSTDWFLKGDLNHNVIPINHAKYDPGNADLHDTLEEILKTKDTDARKTIEVMLEGLMSNIKERRERSRKIDAIYEVLIKDRDRES